jgi:hypothetical protein
MNPMLGNVDGKPVTIQQNGWVSFGSDSQANVRFYKKPVLDVNKSKHEGRPVYVAKDYIRIQHPGEHLNIVDRPVDDDPRVIQRWPQQYQHFINNTQQDIPEGTPVEVLFPDQPEIPANLHGMAVHTVEQLANLSAHALETIGMGAVEWQSRAQRFLDSAKGGKEHHRLVKEVGDLRNQNEVLQNQISLMKDQLNRLIAAQQGVPSMMIPQNRPTVAQAFAPPVQDPIVDTSYTNYGGPFDQNEPQLFSDESPKAPTRTNRKG